MNRVGLLIIGIVLFVAFNLDVSSNLCDIVGFEACDKDPKEG
jgi:hypothetical protein